MRHTEKINLWKTDDSTPFQPQNVTVINADLHAEANSAVEERPFKGRVEKRKKYDSTLPKAVAGGQSPQATETTTKRRHLPRLVKAGQPLAEIRVHQEKQPKYRLKKIEKKGEKLDTYISDSSAMPEPTQGAFDKNEGGWGPTQDCLRLEWVSLAQREFQRISDCPGESAAN